MANSLRRRKSGFVLAVALIALSSGTAAEQTGLAPIQVNQIEIAALIEQHVPPVYPTIAQVAHKEGTVTARLQIAPSGTVDAVLITYSIPLLDQAVLDALRQWRFRPVMSAGVPVSAVTDLDMPFFLTLPENGVAQRFDRLELDCYRSISHRDYAAAEAGCSELAELAGRIPYVRRRANAYHMQGLMLLGREQAAAATAAFSREINVRRSNGDDLNLVFAYQELGRLARARSDWRAATEAFTAAESAVRRYDGYIKARSARTAGERTLREGVRIECAHALKDILLDLIDVLKLSGESADASKAQSRLDKLQSTSTIP